MEASEIFVLIAFTYYLQHKHTNWFVRSSAPEQKPRKWIAISPLSSLVALTTTSGISDSIVSRTRQTEQQLQLQHMECMEDIMLIELQYQAAGLSRFLPSLSLSLFLPSLYDGRTAVRIVYLDFSLGSNARRSRDFSFRHAITIKQLQMPVRRAVTTRPTHR